MRGVRYIMGFFGRLFGKRRPAQPEPLRPDEVVQEGPVPQVQDWERELLRQAVEHRFAEIHRSAVLAELGRMRAELSAAMGAARIDADQIARFVVRAQLDAIEQSGGDPAFFTEQRYQQSDDGLSMDRDRLYLLDVIIKGRQQAAKKGPRKGAS
jgi:hypothetical protein